MAEARWYFIENGAEIGPMAASQLRACARIGRLRPDTPVRTEDMIAGLPARQCPGIFPDVPPDPDFPEGPALPAAQTMRSTRSVPAPAAAAVAEAPAPPPVPALNLPPLPGAGPATARHLDLPELPAAPPPLIAVETTSARRSATATATQTGTRATAFFPSPADLPPLPPPVEARPVSEIQRGFRQETASAAAPLQVIGGVTMPPQMPVPVSDLARSTHPAEHVPERPTSRVLSREESRVGTRIAARVAAPAPVVSASGMVAVRFTPKEPVPLRQPVWTDLWPLAVLSLVLGWIGGGFCDQGRLYISIFPLPLPFIVAVAVPLAFTAFIHYLRPRQVAFSSLGAAAVFTGGIGILMLLMLQLLAWIAMTAPAVFIGPLAIFRGIGWAYQAIESKDVWTRWVGFVLGVGVCEETTKLLPLGLLIVARIGKRQNVHTFLAYGFASGMGFGIGEAVFCYAPWRGNLEVGSNLIRWYSVVPSHAIYTAISAAFLWKLTWWMERVPGVLGGLIVIIIAAFSMAVVHGTYDTICSLGTFAALGMEALSFVFLIFAVKWVSRGQTEPPQEEVLPWTEKYFPVKPMTRKLVAAVAVLVLAIGWGTDRKPALEILLHQLDSRLWDYIDPGVDVQIDDRGQPLAIPMKINFKFSLGNHGLEIVGSFTNSLRHDGLSKVVITCTNGPDHAAFRFGLIKPGETVVVDLARGWRFLPGESLTVDAATYSTERVTLPIPPPRRRFEDQ